MVAKFLMVPAPLFRRILAFIFDIVLLDVLMSPFQSVVLRFYPGLGAGFGANFDQLMANNLSLLYWVLFFVGIIAITYFVLFQYFFKQTIGMMILKLHVQHSEQAEKKKGVVSVSPSLFSLIIRNLFTLPFFPFYLLWILDPINIFFSDKSQRFTEKWSKTMIMHKLQLKD